MQVWSTNTEFVYNPTQLWNRFFIDCGWLWKCKDKDLGWSEPCMDPFLKVNLAFAIVVGLLPQVVCHEIPVLGTIPLCVPQLCWDWMDCTGLCKKFTIEDCTELKQDCLDWVGLWPICGLAIVLSIQKIHLQLTKSIFSVNVNVVRLRNFSGLVYAHFPFYALIIFLFFHCVTRVRGERPPKVVWSVTKWALSDRSFIHSAWNDQDFSEPTPLIFLWPKIPLISF